MADMFENLVYTEDEIILFEKGIPGFENYRRFVLVRVTEFEPFEWLVNVEASKLRFAIINPLLFKPDYNPNINKDQLQDLKLEKAEDVLIYSIVTLCKDPTQTSANLMGPIIINRAKKLGKQIICDDERYSVKERILK